MNLNILFKDFPKICRLCLSPGSVQPILDVKVLSILCAITNIEIKEDDKLPENICNICVKQLEGINVFIDTCKSNDETLRSVVRREYEKSLAAEEESQDFCIDDRFDDDDDFHIKDESEGEDVPKFVTVKQEFGIDPDITDINLNKEDGPVSCENCSENFADRKTLHEHYNEIRNCRPIDYNSESSDVPNILDYLKNSTSEANHAKEDEDDEDTELVNGRKLKGKRKFLCNYCGKNYTRKNGLDRHILSHTGVKPFECRECGKRYITKDTLKTHILTHTGVKAHKCTLCQKSFTQSSHLSYHMRRHSGDKPYSCAFCGKAFLSNYHLERHKLMHTGVKPFECHLCGKLFVRGTTLRDHIFIHTGEKPFQCQHCGKQFNRKQSLTNHVLVHTGTGKSSNSGNGNTMARNLLRSEPSSGHSVFSDL